MLGFLSSASQWQPYLIGPSHFLLRQRVHIHCVCPRTHNAPQKPSVHMEPAPLPDQICTTSSGIRHPPCSTFLLLHSLSHPSLLSFWLIGFTFITASAFSSPSLPHSTLSFNFHRYFIIFQRERWMEVITVGLLKALQFPTRLKGTAFISLLLLRPPFSTVIQSVSHSRIRRAPPMCICSERHKHTHTHQRRQRLKGELS